MIRIKPAGAASLSLQIMKAEDIMIKDVVTVGPEALIRDVATLMLERRISGVPVVDAAGRLLGVLSEGDLIRRPEIETDKIRRGWLGLFVSSDEKAHDFVKSHGRMAREVMTKPAISVTPETPLAEVVHLMERKRVKRLPVVAQGKLVGVVTRTDLLRALVARQNVTSAATETTTPAAHGNQELRDRILAMLRAEDWAASAYISVEVSNGLVNLWGTVESAAQREAVLLAVRGVDGVREVEARLGKEMLS